MFLSLDTNLMIIVKEDKQGSYGWRGWGGGHDALSKAKIPRKAHVKYRLNLVLYYALINQLWGPYGKIFELQF